MYRDVYNNNNVSLCLGLNNLLRILTATMNNNCCNNDDSCYNNNEDYNL